MEHQDERDFEHLHCDDSSDTGDQDRASSAGSLSLADDWVQPDEAEALLPFISPDNWSIFQDDVWRYISLQHRRSYLEQQGISNQSVSATMGHLVWKLSGHDHQTVANEVEPCCQCWREPDCGKYCGQPMGCCKSSRLCRVTSFCRFASWGLLGSRQDLRSRSGSGSSYEAPCNETIDCRGPKKSFRFSSGIFETWDIRKFTGLGWGCCQKMTEPSTGSGSTGARSKDAGPKAGTADSASDCGMPKGRWGCLRRWRLRYPLRRTSHSGKHKNAYRRQIELVFIDQLWMRMCSRRCSSGRDPYDPNNRVTLIGIPTSAQHVRITELSGPKSRNDGKQARATKSQCTRPPGPVPRSLFMLASIAKVRVGAHPTWAAAVRIANMPGHAAAKHSREWDGHSRNYGSSSSQGHHANKAVVKRSFRRACLRAVEHGATAYRGRTLRPQQLTALQRETARRILQGRRRQRPLEQDTKTTGQQGDRMRILTWNSGGLPYHEFAHWLSVTGSSYDVVIVVETRIPNDMEHILDEYTLIHSAAKHAGILVLIHKKLALAHRVTWRAVEAGRILHVKVHGQRQCLNIVGLYQQAWQPHNIPGCIKRRREILRKLDTLLQECSQNQLLLPGGDFNTEVGQWKNLVGPALTPGRDAGDLHPQDWPDLRELMDQRGLCALNTFQAWSPTYEGVGPGGTHVQTRIDFIMTWGKVADASSRQCQYLRAFPVSAHRGTAQHVPLVANLRARWTPWKSADSQRVFNAAHRRQLVGMKQQCLPEWQKWVSSMQHQVTHAMTPAQLNETLNSSTWNIMQAKPWREVPVPTLSLRKDPLWQQGVRHMWTSYREFKRHSYVNLRSVVTVWKHFADFKRASRISRQHARCRKQQLVDEFLHRKPP